MATTVIGQADVAHFSKERPETLLVNSGPLARHSVSIRWVWFSNTRSQRCTDLQSLVKRVDHRNSADTVRNHTRLSLGCAMIAIKIGFQSGPLALHSECMTLS